MPTSATRPSIASGSAVAEAKDGRVALVGISAGGSLALLAAERPRLRERVRVVCALAPYVDLVDVVRLATTGTHVERGRILRYDVDPFVDLVVARSLAAALPRGRDRDVLVRVVRRIPDEHEAPLAVLRGRRFDVGADASALLAVLRNREASRFERLWAALPASVRRRAETLSPLEQARRVDARVELLSAPNDRYFPPAESRAFVRRARDARLTISRTLQHADLDLSLRQLVDLVRLDTYAVRCLRAAAFG